MWYEKLEIVSFLVVLNDWVDSFLREEEVEIGRVCAVGVELIQKLIYLLSVVMGDVSEFLDSCWVTMLDDLARLSMGIFSKSGFCLMD